MGNSRSRSVHVSDCFDSDINKILFTLSLIFICFTSNEEISDIEKTYL